MDEQPSAGSMAFFFRPGKFVMSSGFEIIDLHGDVQLASDGLKDLQHSGAVHSDDDRTRSRIRVVPITR